MDKRFHLGIEDFNAGRYFEAHEILEDMWHEYRETDRTFIQSLIQLSAGFYHYQCANWKGSASQLTKGLKKLEAYKPKHLGVELMDFSAETEHCLDIIMASLQTGAVPESLRIPKILLMPESQPHE